MLSALMIYNFLFERSGRNISDPISIPQQDTKQDTRITRFQYELGNH